MGTCPDIAEAVIKLSQFSVNPSKEYIDKALYILKYVNTTINCKIAYAKKEGFIAISDADWATDQIDRKSITGNIIMLAGAPITWDSRKQKTIAQSSTEAVHRSVENRSFG